MSSKYAKVGWKKYEFPPDMITQEQQTKNMQLNKYQMTQMLKDRINGRIFISGQKGDATTEDEWKRWLVRMENKSIKERVNEEFIQDFIEWLQGRSTYNSTEFEKVVYDENGRPIDRQTVTGTPWGNKPLTFLPGVCEFLDQGIDRRANVIKYLTKLKMRHPRNIDECWMYFKYIVRGVGLDDRGIHEVEFYSKFDYPLGPDGTPEGPLGPSPPKHDNTAYRVNFGVNFDVAKLDPQTYIAWLLNGAPPVATANRSQLEQEIQNLVASGDITEEEVEEIRKTYYEMLGPGGMWYGQIGGQTPKTAGFGSVINYRSLSPADQDLMVAVAYANYVGTLVGSTPGIAPSGEPIVVTGLTKRMTAFGGEKTEKAKKEAKKAAKELVKEATEARAELITGSKDVSMWLPGTSLGKKIVNTLKSKISGGAPTKKQVQAREAMEQMKRAELKPKRRLTRIDKLPPNLKEKDAKMEALKDAKEIQHRINTGKVEAERLIVPPAKKPVSYTAKASDFDDEAFYDAETEPEEEELDPPEFYISTDDDDDGDLEFYDIDPEMEKLLTQADAMVEGLPGAKEATKEIREALLPVDPEVAKTLIDAATSQDMFDPLADLNRFIEAGSISAERASFLNFARNAPMGTLFFDMLFKDQVTYDKTTQKFVENQTNLDMYNDLTDAAYGRVPLKELADKYKDYLGPSKERLSFVQNKLDGLEGADVQERTRQQMLASVYIASKTQIMQTEFMQAMGKIGNVHKNKEARIRLMRTFGLASRVANVGNYMGYDGMYVPVRLLQALAEDHPMVGLGLPELYDEYHSKPGQLRDGIRIGITELQEAFNSAKGTEMEYTAETNDLWQTILWYGSRVSNYTKYYTAQKAMREDPEFAALYGAKAGEDIDDSTIFEMLQPFVDEQMNPLMVAKTANVIRYDVDQELDKLMAEFAKEGEEEEEEEEEEEKGEDNDGGDDDDDEPPPPPPPPGEEEHKEEEEEEEEPPPPPPPEPEAEPPKKEPAGADLAQQHMLQRQLRMESGQQFERQLAEVAELLKNPAAPAGEKTDKIIKLAQQWREYDKQTDKPLEPWIEQVKELAAGNAEIPANWELLTSTESRQRLAELMKTRRISAEERKEAEAKRAARQKELQEKLELIRAKEQEQREKEAKLEEELKAAKEKKKAEKAQRAAELEELRKKKEEELQAAKSKEERKAAKQAAKLKKKELAEAAQETLETEKQQQEEREEMAAKRKALTEELEKEMAAMDAFLEKARKATELEEEQDRTLAELDKQLAELEARQEAEEKAFNDAVEKINKATTVEELEKLIPVIETATYEEKEKLLKLAKDKIEALQATVNTDTIIQLQQGLARIKLSAQEKRDVEEFTVSPSIRVLKDEIGNFKRQLTGDDTTTFPGLTLRIPKNGNILSSPENVWKIAEAVAPKVAKDKTTYLTAKQADDQFALKYPVNTHGLTDEALAFVDALIRRQEREDPEHFKWHKTIFGLIAKRYYDKEVKFPMHLYKDKKSADYETAFMKGPADRYFHDRQQFLDNYARIIEEHKTTGNVKQSSLLHAEQSKYAMEQTRYQFMMQKLAWGGALEEIKSEKQGIRNYNNLGKNDIGKAVSTMFVTDILKRAKDIQAPEIMKPHKNFDPTVYDHALDLAEKQAAAIIEKYQLLSLGLSTKPSEGFLLADQTFGFAAALATTNNGGNVAVGDQAENFARHEIMLDPRMVNAVDYAWKKRSTDLETSVKTIKDTEAAKPGLRQVREEFSDEFFGDARMYDPKKRDHPMVSMITKMYEERLEAKKKREERKKAPATEPMELTLVKEKPSTKYGIDKLPKLDTPQLRKKLIELPPLRPVTKKKMPVRLPARAPLLHPPEPLSEAEAEVAPPPPPKLAPLPTSEPPPGMFSRFTSIVTDPVTALASKLGAMMRKAEPEREPPPPVESALPAYFYEKYAQQNPPIAAKAFPSSSPAEGQPRMEYGKTSNTKRYTNILTDRHGMLKSGVLPLPVMPASSALNKAHNLRQANGVLPRQLAFLDFMNKSLRTNLPPETLVKVINPMVTQQGVAGWQKLSMGRLQKDNAMSRMYASMSQEPIDPMTHPPAAEKWSNEYSDLFMTLAVGAEAYPDLQKEAAELFGEHHIITQKLAEGTLGGTIKARDEAAKLLATLDFEGSTSVMQSLVNFMNSKRESKAVKALAEKVENDPWLAEGYGEEYRTIFSKELKSMPGRYTKRPSSHIGWAAHSKEFSKRLFGREKRHAKTTEVPAELVKSNRYHDNYMALASLEAWAQASLASVDKHKYFANGNKGDNTASGTDVDERVQALYDAYSNASAARQAFIDKSFRPLINDSSMYDLYNESEAMVNNMAKTFAEVLMQEDKMSWTKYADEINSAPGSARDALLGLTGDLAGVGRTLKSMEVELAEEVVSGIDRFTHDENPVYPRPRFIKKTDPVTGEISKVPVPDKNKESSYLPEFVNLLMAAQNAKRQESGARKVIPSYYGNVVKTSGVDKLTPQQLDVLDGLKHPEPMKNRAQNLRNKILTTWKPRTDLTIKRKARNLRF